MLLFYLCVCGGVFLISRAFRKDFALAAPFFMLSAAATLYLTSLVDGLLIGLAALILASVSGYVLLAREFYLAKTKPGRHRLADLVGWSFLAFTALYLIMMLVFFRKNLTVWDDFSHWGPMLTETVRTDTLYSFPSEVTSAHRDYPPVPTLMEYFGCKIAGGYSEPMAMLALSVFTLAFLMPFFYQISAKSQPIRFFISMAVAVALPALSTATYFYYTLYIDTTVAVMFGYGLALVATTQGRSVFERINVPLFCFVLIAAKQISIFFILGILIYYVVVFLHPANRCQITRSRASFVSWAMTPMSALVAAGLAYVSWSTHLSMVNLKSSQFDVSAIFNGLIDLLRGNPAAYHSEVIINYINALASRGVLGYPISFPYLYLCLFLAGGLILLVHARRHDPDRVEVRIFALTLVLLSLGYSVLMLVLYLFSFGEYEGVRLASYERYMGTFWVGAVVSTVLILAHLSRQPDETSNQAIESRWSPSVPPWLAIGLIVLVNVPPAGYTALLPLHDHSTHDRLQPHAEVLSTQLDYPTDKVYLIIQATNGGDYWALKYYANPLNTQQGGWSIGTASYEGDIWTLDLTAHQWSRELRDGGFTHVYLVAVNDLFTEEYGELFDPTGDIAAGQLFEVTSPPDADTVRLVPA